MNHRLLAHTQYKGFLLSGFFCECHKIDGSIGWDERVSYAFMDNFYVLWSIIEWHSKRERNSIIDCANFSVSWKSSLLRSRCEMNWRVDLCTLWVSDEFMTGNFLTQIDWWAQLHTATWKRDKLQVHRAQSGCGRVFFFALRERIALFHSRVAEYVLALLCGTLRAFKVLHPAASNQCERSCWICWKTFHPFFHCHLTSRSLLLYSALIAITLHQPCFIVCKVHR